MPLTRLSAGLAASSLILALGAGPARAQAGPPELDLAETCRSAGSIGVGPRQDSRDGCLRSETEARDEVRRRWGEFGATAKTQCGQQAQLGGSPGYVELITCLELASGSPPASSGGKAKGAGGAAPTRPAPDQRTNPIDVLDKPASR